MTNIEHNVMKTPHNGLFLRQVLVGPGDTVPSVTMTALLGEQKMEICGIRKGTSPAVRVWRMTARGRQSNPA